MQRAITGYHQDAEGHWVAELSCGHGQHVRHVPPFTLRPWVLTPEGRASRLGQHLDCPPCDRRELPSGFVAYRRTPTFTGETVPRALLERHDTKAGVWGVLHVASGSLELIEHLLEGPGEHERRHRVNAGQTHTICPQLEHRVALLGPVEFFLELWRAPRAAQAPR